MAGVDRNDIRKRKKVRWKMREDLVEKDEYSEMDMRLAISGELKSEEKEVMYNVRVKVLERNG